MFKNISILTAILTSPLQKFLMKISVSFLFIKTEFGFIPVAERAISTNTFPLKSLLL